MRMSVCICICIYIYIYMYTFRMCLILTGLFATSGFLGGASETVFGPFQFVFRVVSGLLPNDFSHKNPQQSF